ncbi:protein lifeguard 2-like isoform X2 [Aricia agestis]|uniref:protein lifeguard 2-like isoform X2 n=1 Tax=Aricia agestis TaxID=91739 RepID=UPI001C2034AF|nr:protein lifeguard 2-like isoform X2 [Aricia agestis]
MNDIKNDASHNTYKRLKEEQTDPAGMAYASQPMEFTNPISGAYPNPSAMSQPNPSALAYPNASSLGLPNQSAMAQPNTSATAYPNANPQGHPNQSAMAQPNTSAMTYPNPSNMAYPNQNAMAYPNQNAMAQPNSNPVYPNQNPTAPDSKYAMVYPEGTTKYSTDSDTPIMSNEPPKPNDETMDFEVHGFDFSEQFIRKMFIRKVYAVLMSQLLLTVAITAFFMYCEPIRVFMMQPQNMLPVYMSMGVLGMVLICMMLCTELRRVAPWNFIFLAIFTVTQGIIVGILAIYCGKDEVLLAFGITAAVVLALTLFAFQTKWDFTTIGGGLLATLVVLIIFSSIAAFMPYYRTMNLLYCGIGVILFSFYIIYDTQLMIGGEHKYSVSPEEYIFAALTLYLDILNLFIYILRLLRS